MGDGEDSTSPNKKAKFDTRAEKKPKSDKKPKTDVADDKKSKKPFKKDGGDKPFKKDAKKPFKKDADGKKSFDKDGKKKFNKNKENKPFVKLNKKAGCVHLYQLLSSPVFLVSHWHSCVKWSRL